MKSNQKQLKIKKKTIGCNKKNNHLKVQKKDDKRKGIVYLSERLNRLIKLYPSSFNDREICNK